ncbi:GNAT family N-acetyltransferase [Streptomyces hoynatensis]|uniref:GNAT family N-acetyltransferase n=1 Tax=Streptomyces hoynatensis TaxID=1141874 RepID=UPI003BAAE5CE
MVRARRVGTDGHVGRLGIVPDLRGRGLGRGLLHLAEAAAEPRCRRTVLHTGARSRRNIGLYRGRGIPAGAGRRGRRDRLPRQERGLLTTGGRWGVGRPAPGWGWAWEAGPARECRAGPPEPFPVREWAPCCRRGTRRRSPPRCSAAGRCRPGCSRWGG